MRRWRKSSGLRRSAVRLGAALLLVACACTDGSHGRPAQRAPALAGGAAVALGNLRLLPPPSERQAELARFLFGVEPDAPPRFIKPMEIVARDAELFIADGGLQEVLRWSFAENTLAGTGIAAGESFCGIGGDGLLTAAGGSIHRYGPANNPAPRLEGLARVGGMIAVGGELWLSDTVGHRIVICDAASGQTRRTIGRRGRGPGEFGIPLGLATDGTHVFVADMLNARVQVLGAGGEWVRDIGGPGNRPGYFGRPKSVAVGPDGTVFVADAASQCIHAFNPDGRPLLTFGGADAGDGGLVLPGGLAIWTGPAPGERALPEGFEPRYYVLAAEQIVRPGIRVFAWRGAAHDSLAAPRSAAPRLAASVTNPHWRDDQCRACHAPDAGAPRAIAAQDVDRICLSCHDGTRATKESHSVGRPAITPHTSIPPDWPLHEGRIGCLTCHDVRRHCATGTNRPSENAAMVRGHDSRDPLKSCTQCHDANVWRVNPHRSEIPGLSGLNAGCRFCHTTTSGGSAEVDGALRDSPTRLCLNCHVMHADPAPRGHLGALATEEMQRIAWRLPFENGRVTCATCHNPHPPEVTALSATASPRALVRSRDLADAGKALRVEHLSLCLTCHPK